MTFLVDDGGLQPAEIITPVVRRDVLEAHDVDVERRINDVTRRLTTRELAALVPRADDGCGWPPLGGPQPLAGHEALDPRTFKYVPPARRT